MLDNSKLVAIKINLVDSKQFLYNKIDYDRIELMRMQQSKLHIVKFFVLYRYVCLYLVYISIVLLDDNKKWNAASASR